MYDFASNMLIIIKLGRVKKGGKILRFVLFQIVCLFVCLLSVL